MLSSVYCGVQSDSGTCRRSPKTQQKHRSQTVLKELLEGRSEQRWEECLEELLEGCL